MKKLLAIVVAAIMMLSMVAFAADGLPTTLKEVIEDIPLPSGEQREVLIRRTLDVPVNMQVDVGKTGTYVDGPVSETISGSNVSANYKATIYMADVRTLFEDLLAEYKSEGGLVYQYIDFMFSAHPEERRALETRVDNSIVTGEFIIKIVFPENVIVPNSVLTGTALSGFNAGAATTFEETVPRVLNDGVGGTKELEIKISVKEGITASVMEANLQAYLPDITFTCTNAILGLGTTEVVGSITGWTEIYDDNTDPTPDDLICKINYTGKQGTDSGVTGGTEISETVTLSETQQGGATPVIPGGTTTEPSGPIEVEVKLPSISETETIIIPEGTKNPTIDIEEITEKINPTRDGFVFDGFYADEFYTQKLEGEVPVTEDTTIYGRFINITVPEIFNADEHIQYIYGYPDGTVRPEANVKREEVTAMLYRLLKPEVRAELETSENNFSDVPADKWSIVPISSMAKGGYIYGYTDGSFKPDEDITRAELAAIISRFVGRIVEGERTFNDIDGHWAEASIKSVANNEWIFGYTDGSFKPDAKITRAETVAIINRVVVRYVTQEGLTGDERIWPDNPATAWYYYPVIEASHHHEHERDENNYSELWNTAISN